MLEKIPIERLEPGMHVERLCGRWIDHPFWRTKFIVRDARHLRTLLDSGVAECWIDRSKSPSDVSRGDPGASAEEAVAAPRALAAEELGAFTEEAVPGPDTLESTACVASGAAARVPLEEELGRAQVVFQQASAAVASLFGEVRHGKDVDTGRCLSLVDTIARSVERHPTALVSLAHIRTHSRYTFAHSVAVSALMIALARQCGFDETREREAGLAGLLHDIGKADVPASILETTGPLDDREHDRMRGHPAYGHRMLREGSDAAAPVLQACLHHHERFDGAGYPEGLRGEAIPRSARMNAICDVYDAITSQRPYKPAWDRAESIARMAAWSRAGQFDPQLFRAFVGMVGVYPVGSLVRLQSRRLAVVVETNPAAPASPCVKVFYSARTRMPVPLNRIDLSRPGSHDRIVARESNRVWGFGHLDELVLGEHAPHRGGAPR